MGSPREGRVFRRLFSFAPLALAPALALGVAGCSSFGGRSPGPESQASVTPVAAGGEEMDVRRYLGPDYCPELRIRPGTEVLRLYEKGHEDDPAHVVWQASIGKTARECLYDGQGGLTMKIGVSGRVVAGPKGAAETVSLPLRVAVVKNKEAVLASELQPLPVTIPAGSAAVFSEVRQVAVPSPGADRDYILYVGLDEKGENMLDPAGALPKEPPEKAVKEDMPVVDLTDPALTAPAAQEPPKKKKPVPPPQPAAAPAAPAEPNVLPTPSGGFVLGGGG